MTTEPAERVDEVSGKYEPAQRADAVCGWLFYVLVVLSFLVLFPDLFNGTVATVIKIAFLLLTLGLFCLFLVSKLYLIPSAERVRRRELLANAFGTHLVPEATKGYYNNGFPPSHQRLAANVMENAYFGKEVSKLMLHSVRGCG